MRDHLNDFLLAISYFTRLPVTGFVRFTEAGLERAVGWFPLVGWLVGGIAAAVLYGASMVLPLEIAVLLALAAGIVATGAFHEDGLADTADGFGPVGDRDQALAAMKDSRLGSFGVLALGIVLALKFVALVQFANATAAAVALLVTHPLSRLPPVAVIATQHYLAQSTSRARLVAQRLPRGSWLPALVAALLPGLVLLPWPRVLLGVGILAVTTVILTVACRARFGGYTGDTLGALQQLSETAILLCLIAAPPSA